MVTSQSLGETIAFSPDDDKLVYSNNSDGDYEIYTYDLNQDTIKQLTENNKDDKWPSWTKNGGSYIYKLEYENDNWTPTVLISEERGAAWEK